MKESEIMWVIAQHGPCTTKHIAELFETETTNISKQIRRLCDMGLVDRELTETDNPGQQPYLYELSKEYER